VQDKSFRIVPRSQDLDSIASHLRRPRDLGQEPAVRAAKPKLAVGLPIELVALLVNGAMVAAAEQSEIRERGGAALRPVTDVMSLAESDHATREPAAAVAVVERPPEGRRDCAGPGIDLHDMAVPAVAHHHPARVAGQAL
jgi:hypothetical protein